MACAMAGTFAAISISNRKQTYGFSYLKQLPLNRYALFATDPSFG